MATTIYSLNGYANGTDIGSVVGITRAFGSVGELVVNANGYLTISTGSHSLATMNAGSASHKITTVYASGGQSSSMVCCVNVIDIDNFFCLRYDSSELQLFKRVAGTFTLLASVAVSFFSSGSLSLIYDAITNRLTAQKDGVNVTGLINIDPLVTLASSNLVGIHGRQAATDFVDSFTVEGFGASIDSIDEPVIVGGAFDFTTSGLTGITSITTDKAGVTVSGITADTSATISPWVDGALYPMVPCDLSLTFDDGSASAVASTTLEADATFTDVEALNPITSNSNTIGGAIKLATGRIVSSGDVMYHTVPVGMSDLVVLPRTDFSTTNAGSFDLWLWVSGGADAGKMYYYRVTITDGGGVVVSGGLTSAGLTSSGFTSSGLTSPGL